MEFINSYTKTLKNKYFFILFLFFATFTLFSIVLTSFISEEKNLSASINIAGKQRLLNEKAYNTLMNYIEFTRASDEEKLKNVLLEIENNQKILFRDKNISKNIKSTNKIIDDYLNLYKEYLKTNNTKYIELINKEFQKIYFLFDSNTKLFERNLDNRLNFIKFSILITTLIFIIITILASYFIVFPTIKKIQHQDDELKRLNSSLSDDLKLKIAQLEEANQLAKLGVWEYDITSNKLKWSKEIFNMFEIEIEQGSSYELFINRVHPDDKHLVESAYLQHIEEKEPYEIKHRLLFEDGRVKWVLEKCNTIFDENGNPLVSTGIVQDISVQEENREKEITIIEQSKMVSMGQMIGNIAHQWRQPLASINTAMMKLKVKAQLGELSSKELIDSSKRIGEYTNYLSKTIDTFTNYIKNQKILKTLPIEDEIKDAITIAGIAINDNNIKLINNIDFSKQNILKMTTGELSEVIINILNNAKDALLSKEEIEEKWIKIDLKSDDKQVIITIEDNAGGMSDKVINRIFEPYFTTKHKSQGTGLGLHICNKIIKESFNGNLSAKNSINGAIFNIEIPII